MRTIKAELIAEKVKELFIKAAFTLPPKVKDDLQNALKLEKSPTGRSILEKLRLNSDLAQAEQIPLCQDTGSAQVLIELGQEVLITNGRLNDAINRGVAAAYQEAFLRKSMVNPLNRSNQGDNCPAQIEFSLIEGDRLTITCAPKGGGCDNMGQLRMLKPAAGAEGIIKSVMEAIQNAGANPCPPIYVGVAIGGTFESAPRLAKKALWANINPLRPLTPEEEKFSRELLTAINQLGLGPAGLGGTITALGVVTHIHPCHMASLPVAVNLSCHSFRMAWEEI